MSDAQGAPAGASAPTANSTAAVDSSSEVDVNAGAESAAEDVSALFRKHKHKVKIDDVEDEVDYDELRTGYQRAKAADARFKKAAELAKQLRPQIDELELFKKNPWEAIKKAGQDPYALAEQLLLEKLEWENLPEAERRARQAELREKMLEERLTKAEKAEKERARQASEAQALQEIDDEIGEAIKATGRKATPRLIARITETLIAHHEAQLETLHRQYGAEIPEQAYERVKRLPASDAVNRTFTEYVHELREFVPNLSIEELRQVLSRDQLDGLRKAEVDKVLAQDPTGSRKPRQQLQQAPRQKPTTKRMSTDEFFKKLEEKTTKRA